MFFKEIHCGFQKIMPIVYIGETDALISYIATIIVKVCIFMLSDENIENFQYLSMKFSLFKIVVWLIPS